MKLVGNILTYSRKYEKHRRKKVLKNSSIHIFECLNTWFWRYQKVFYFEMMKPNWFIFYLKFLRYFVQRIIIKTIYHTKWPIVAATSSISFYRYKNIFNLRNPQ